MVGKTISIELPEDLWATLIELAGALGIASADEAAIIAIAEWASRRRSELDDRDPAQKYFVNEALDQLAAAAMRPKRSPKD